MHLNELLLETRAPLTRFYSYPSEFDFYEMYAYRDNPGSVDTQVKWLKSSQNINATHLRQDEIPEQLVDRIKSIRGIRGGLGRLPIDKEEWLMHTLDLDTLDKDWILHALKKWLRAMTKDIDQKRGLDRRDFLFQTIKDLYPMHWAWFERGLRDAS